MPQLDRNERAAIRGSAIRALHLAQPELTKTEIARRVGVTHMTVSYHLSGRSKCLRPDQAPMWDDALRTLCAALADNRPHAAMAATARLQSILTTCLLVA